MVQLRPRNPTASATKLSVRSRPIANVKDAVPAAKESNVKAAGHTTDYSNIAARRKGKSGERSNAIQPNTEPGRPKRKRKAIINKAPNKRLKVYVFGDGSAGQLGLGISKNVVEVRRPRLNPFFAPDTIGVTQIAVGSMHAAALTHDNKIYTWGVNDLGALGRDTHWEGGMRNIDQGCIGDDSHSSDLSDSADESDINPREATPTAIPSKSFPQGTVFVELAAGDSTTFVLTDEGLVFGWGTFRVSL